MYLAKPSCAQPAATKPAAAATPAAAVSLSHCRPHRLLPRHAPRRRRSTASRSRPCAAATSGSARSTRPPAAARAALAWLWTSAPWPSPGAPSAPLDARTHAYVPPPTPPLLLYGSHADDFAGRALGIPSRGNATIAASGVRLSTSLELISSSSGVPVASNLSRTSLAIPQGGLQLTIEGSDWEARVISGFETVIALALQGSIPGLVAAQLDRLVAMNGTAALQRRTSARHLLGPLHLLGPQLQRPHLPCPYLSGSTQHSLN